jgi:FtsZ-binding cell division protein ZapB
MKMEEMIKKEIEVLKGKENSCQQQISNMGEDIRNIQAVYSTLKKQRERLEEMLKAV